MQRTAQVKSILLDYVHDQKNSDYTGIGTLVNMIRLFNRCIHSIMDHFYMFNQL